MTSSLTDTVAKEIRRLHADIEAALRATVNDALRIGGLLTQKKAELGHGHFLTWIHESVGFSESTAQRYMRLHRWRDDIVKSVSVTDLTEAYRRVEALETKEKQKSRQEPHDTVVDAEPATPGSNGQRKKPEASEEQRAKVAEFTAKMAREDHEEKPQPQEQETSRAEMGDLLQRIDEQILKMQEAAKRFSHLTLSGGSDDLVQASMLDLIQRYVLSFEPAARRVEVAHNLIKALRVLIHEVNGEEASA